jgi:hypothetical protein
MLQDAAKRVDVVELRWDNLKTLRSAVAEVVAQEPIPETDGGVKGGKKKKEREGTCEDDDAKGKRPRRRTSSS